jgi:hypothetical protein
MENNKVWDRVWNKTVSRIKQSLGENRIWNKIGRDSTYSPWLFPERGKIAAIAEQ